MRLLTLGHIMKPTRRIKVKNGIEYWYEKTPYYDKEKKQIRHKSKYLGRNIDGQLVRMRSAPAEVKAKTKKKLAPARSSFDYGSIFTLQKIMEELSIDRYLQELLSPSDAAMVQALALNRIIRPMAMNKVEAWYEGTSLALESLHVNLSSQRVSELLGRLGESDIPDRFMARLVEGTDTK